MQELIFQVIDASRTVKDFCKSKNVKSICVIQGKIYAGCKDSSVQVSFPGSGHNFETTPSDKTVLIDVVCVVLSGNNSSEQQRARDQSTIKELDDAKAAHKLNCQLQRLDVHCEYGGPWVQYKGEDISAICMFVLEKPWND